MPRKSRAFDADRVTRVYWNAIETITLTNQATDIAAGIVGIQPSGFGARLGVVANSYQLYRITDLKFSLLPNISYDTGGTSVSGVVCAGAYLGESDVTANSIIQVSESPWICYFGAGQTTPSSFHITRSDFLGGDANLWYKTEASANTEPWTETQGEIQIVANLSNIDATTHDVVIVSKGCCEFKSPTNTNLTPLLKTPGAPRRVYARSSARPEGWNSGDDQSRKLVKGVNPVAAISNFQQGPTIKPPKRFSLRLEEDTGDPG